MGINKCIDPNFCSVPHWVDTYMVHFGSFILGLAWTVHFASGPGPLQVLAHSLQSLLLVVVTGWKEVMTKEL